MYRTRNSDIGQSVKNSFNEILPNKNHDMLEKEKPDVVVYETVERYLNNMLHFSITDGIEADAEQ